MNYPTHPVDGIIDHKMIWLEENGSWHQRPRTTAELSAFKSQAELMVRVKRDEFLRDSDIMIMADRWANYTDETRTAWTLYRQQLRELTTQSGFPYNLNWPTKP